MKNYNNMKDGEKQICSHCGTRRERSEWFLKQKICDWCIDNNKPCQICNKMKLIVSQYEVDEVICTDCKEFICGESK